MTLPLVFRHGAAETVFIVAVLVWVVSEAVMRVIHEYEHFAAGRKRLVPGVW